MRVSTLWLKGWLLALLVPLAGFVLFGSTGRDDAYITFWVAEQLAATGHVVNYNGAAVEQSSSLLHALVLAALLKGLPLPSATVAFWLGIVCGIACVPAAMALARRIHPRAGLPAALLAATCAPATYWAFGSLETSLATLALLLALLAAARALEDWTRPKQVLAALACLLLTIARPEFAIIVMAAMASAAVLICLRRPAAVADARRLAVLTAMVLAWFALVGLARLAAFGSWFPQPVMAKTGVTVRWNVEYTTSTLLQSLTVGVVLLALLGLVRARRSAPLALTLATGVMGLLGITTSGGDWMECGRLLAPWLVVLAVAAAGTVATIERPALRLGLLAVAVGLGLAGEVNYARNATTGAPLGGEILLLNPDGTRLPQVATLWPEAHNRLHSRDAAFVQSVEPLLRELAEKRRGREPLVLASGQAGMIVYYLKRSFGEQLRFIDRRGLTTVDLTQCGKDGPRTPGGMAISYDRWLQNPQACGPPPDVVLDAGEFSRRGDLPKRYRLLFQQLGSGSSSGPAGRRRLEHELDQFLAVRNDL